MQSTRVVGFIGLALCATAQAGPTALTVKDAAAGQGNNPYTPLLFTIERTGDLSYPVKIEFVSEPDPDAANPAAPDVDFLARYITSYELPAGEAAPTLPVSLLRAAAGRPDRGLVVRILNVGIPKFEPRHDVCHGGDIASLAVADFNGDGLPDLAGARNDSGVLQLCTNRSSGDGLQFSEPVYLQVHAAGASFNENLTGVAAGDLDGDTRTDLVVSNGSSNTVFILANRTPDLADALTFEIVQALPVFNRPGTLALADFDGDGRLDVAAGGEIGSCPQAEPDNSCTSDVYLFRNVTGAGASAPSFEALERLLAGMFVYRLLAEDFTSDGRPDLAAVTSAGIDLFHNATLPGEAPSFAARTALMQTSPASDASAFDMDAADFDGDGRRDIAVQHGGTISVLTALGGGAFSAPQPVYVEPLRESGHQEGPTTVRAIDFNNDRKPDLAVGNWLVDDAIDDDLRIGSSLMTLLENRTAPGLGYRFPVDVELRVAGVFTEFSVTDVDADGRFDIVTPSYYESRVSVLRRADNAVDLPRPFGRGTALATLPALELAPVSDATASAMVASEELVISGITYAAPITVAQGSYTVNGAQRTGLSYVSAGDVVRVETQAPAAVNAQGKASLMIGGVGGEFSVTTTATATADGGSAGGGVPLATLAVLLLAALGRARRSHREAAFQ